MNDQFLGVRESMLGPLDRGGSPAMGPSSAPRPSAALPGAGAWVPRAVLPAIKFFKDAVEDILAGRKTLEPRPRSPSWIERLEKVGQASLTYGPRFGAPTVFATARITDVTVRPFGSVTVEDLARIGYGWSDRSCKEFVVEYTRWFAKELAKGYPVAWISFEVIDR